MPNGWGSAIQSLAAVLEPLWPGYGESILTLQLSKTCQQMQLGWRK